VAPVRDRARAWGVEPVRGRARAARAGPGTGRAGWADRLGVAGGAGGSGARRRGVDREGGCCWAHGRPARDRFQGLTSRPPERCPGRRRGRPAALRRGDAVGRATWYTDPSSTRRWPASARRRPPGSSRLSTRCTRTWSGGWRRRAPSCSTCGRRCWTAPAWNRPCASGQAGRPDRLQDRDHLAAGGAAGPGSGVGLRSMAERIQTAGGHLEISSQPYQGTQVVLAPSRRALSPRRGGGPGAGGGRPWRPRRPPAHGGTCRRRRSGGPARRGRG